MYDDINDMNAVQGLPMNIRFNYPDGGTGVKDEREGGHAVLSGRVRRRREVSDESGHHASVTVFEIGYRSGREGQSHQEGQEPDTQENYLTMLLLSGDDPAWAESRVLSADESRPEAGMTLVVDGTTKVCDVVRYASGILRKG